MSAVAELTTAPGTRDPTLDAFRGLTVVGMGLVNLQGSSAASFTQLAHAPWHGITAADLVFPFFLLVVGLATPLALDRAAKPYPISRILRRALLLIAIGIALNWLLRPTFDWPDLRLTGVLQRIGIVYLACALLARVRPGCWAAFGTAAALLILHTVVLLLVPAPGESAPSLAPGLGVSGWLDRLALPGRLLRETYDPEGVLSTLPAIASGLIGVGISRWLNTQSRRARSLAAAAIVLLVAGALATVIVPLNKSLWTASFALVTAGLGLLAWVALRAAWPRLAGWRLARGCVVLGQTALTLYIVQMLVIALLVIRTPDGMRWWQVLFDRLATTGIPPAWASLLFAVAFSLPCCALMPFLQRRGWLIRA